MKKIQGVIALLVGLMVVFSGCSSKKTDKVENSTSTEGTQSTSSSSIQGEDSQESTAPSSSQDATDVHTTDGSIGAAPSPKSSAPVKSSDAPPKGTTGDNKTAAKAPGTTSGTEPKKHSGTSSRSNSSGAGLMGEVTEIQDGSVTLKLVEMPQRGGNGGHVRPSPGAGAPSGTPPQGQGHAQMSPKYTGETKTVKIPAGIPVTMVTRGQSGMETKNIEIKDIKAGDMLQVWFSDADKTVVSKVSVSNFGKK
ncbi:MAG TPA: hypothetical protein VF941_09930 [Clostridia bacterium]